LGDDRLPLHQAHMAKGGLRTLPLEVADAKCRRSGDVKSKESLSSLPQGTNQNVISGWSFAVSDDDRAIDEVVMSVILPTQRAEMVPVNDSRDESEKFIPVGCIDGV